MLKSLKTKFRPSLNTSYQHAKIEQTKLENNAKKLNVKQGYQWWIINDERWIFKQLLEVWMANYEF